MAGKADQLARFDRDEAADRLARERDLALAGPRIAPLRADPLDHQMLFGSQRATNIDAGGALLRDQRRNLGQPVQLDKHIGHGITLLG